MEQNTNTKCVLIGTFVRKGKILSFLEMLRGKFKIYYDKIFVYELSNNSLEYLVTFKAVDKNKYIKFIKGATVMHVKNGCIFSINALNRYIESKNGVASSSYQIDWDELKDKLVIVSNGSLTIQDMTKIDDKCNFLD